MPEAARAGLPALFISDLHLSEDEPANADAVAALLREHGYPTLVHGHTHRPDCHRLQLDGRDCVRHVLADWHGTARWLAFDGVRLTTEGSPTPA